MLRPLFSLHREATKIAKEYREDQDHCWDNKVFTYNEALQDSKGCNYRNDPCQKFKRVFKRKKFLHTNPLILLPVRWSAVRIVIFKRYVFVRQGIQSNGANERIRCVNNNDGLSIAGLVKPSPEMHPRF
jgi:hypothetical protein